MPASPTTEFTALSAVCTQLRTIRPGMPPPPPWLARAKTSSGSSSFLLLPRQGPGEVGGLVWVYFLSSERRSGGGRSRNSCGGASSAAGFDEVAWGAGETRPWAAEWWAGGRGRGEKKRPRRDVDESRGSVRVHGRGRVCTCPVAGKRLRRHVPRRTGWRVPVDLLSARIVSYVSLYFVWICFGCEFRFVVQHDNNVPMMRYHAPTDTSRLKQSRAQPQHRPCQVFIFTAACACSYVLGIFRMALGLATYWFL